jgi:hypothetical protein
MVLHGQWDNEMFAVNLAGLALSSTAVTAAMQGLRFVKPLGSLSRYRGVAKVLRLTRGVPGWVYGGVQTAVVLYFAEVASARISGWLDERRARQAVDDAAQAVLAAATRATSDDDAELKAALEHAVVTYTAWRDRALRPALEANARLQEAMAEAGREAAVLSVGGGPFNAIAQNYPGVQESLDRVNAAKESEIEAKLARALERFEKTRADALQRALYEGERHRAYDPRRDAGDVSENRRQAYADEALLYDAAAEAAGDPTVAAGLREWAAVTREVAARELELLGPQMGIEDHLPQGGSR